MINGRMHRFGFECKREKRGEIYKFLLVSIYIYKFLLVTLPRIRGNVLTYFLFFLNRSDFVKTPYRDTCRYGLWCDMCVGLENYFKGSLQFSFDTYEAPTLCGMEKFWRNFNVRRILFSSGIQHEFSYLIFVINSPVRVMNLKRCLIRLANRLFL